MGEELPDSEIAGRIRSGGQDGRAAEDALCKRFAARIRLYGLRHLGDGSAAADLVQVVLVRVLEALRAGRVENVDNLPAYVLGTCRFAAYDLRRAELRQRAIEAGSVALATDVQPPATSGSDVVRLIGCLQHLGARESQIVRMTFMEDKSADEIAARMQLSSGNVRVLRHRALARLHECVDGGGA
jgi:RNA polymerase sigma-70 factor (ECF subfamily)